MPGVVLEVNRIREVPALNVILASSIHHDQVEPVTVTTDAPSVSALTLEFEEYFEKAGDLKSAAIMKAIHKDEIHHVAFGLKWLRILKPADQSEWDAYLEHLHWPLRPDKSVGDVFHREPRIAAGMTAEFIDRLQPEGNSEKTATDNK